MLCELNQFENPTVGEKLGKFIAEKGIKTKMMLGSWNQSDCLTCKEFTDSIEAENIVFKNGRNMEISRWKTGNRKRSKFLKKILESPQAQKAGKYIKQLKRNLEDYITIQRLVIVV